MTYCALISDKFRYCQLVNSDLILCVFFRCLSHALSVQRDVTYMYFTFSRKTLSCSIDILEII